MLDVYQCSSGHRFVRAVVESPWRENMIPCAFCEKWANFTSRVDEADQGNGGISKPCFPMTLGGNGTTYKTNVIATEEW